MTTRTVTVAHVIARFRRHGALLGVALSALVVGALREGYAQYSPNPAPGPYYFVSDTCGDDACSPAGQFFWRTGLTNAGVESGTGEGYAGVPNVANFNLLARVLGDNPPSVLPKGQTLVDEATFPALGTLQLQPFAIRTAGVSDISNLPLSATPLLKAKLNDPLGGTPFDLTLPFTDQNIGLSNHSGLLRGGTTTGVWHVAVDFDRNSNTGNAEGEFDVVAAADGSVEGNTNTDGGNGCPIVLRHTAPNGQQFFTIYQHLRCESPKTDASLSHGSSVRRGQKLGKVKLVDTSGSPYAHLHFALSVPGPAGTDSLGKPIPATNYLLDPFGVYDYRRNLGDTTNYNYLPNNRLDVPTHGRVHAYAWRTDPVIGSLLLPEDCLSFNPANLTIVQSGSVFQLLDGTHALFAFPTSQEANTARSIIQQHGANKSCFIGRPNPSFTYMLVNGQSPGGAATGEDCVSFNPAIIALTPQGDGTVLMTSGTHSMFVFPNMLEAGNALSVIRKYGFTKTCFVGRPDPSLQYMRKDGGTTGAFAVSPPDASAVVGGSVKYSFVWTVPPPGTWHDLQTLRFRIRGGSEEILSLQCDMASRTINGHPVGSPAHLETSHATVDLADSSLVGGGPTSPSVTLNLSVSFKNRAAGQLFSVDVGASDTLGHVDDLVHAGWITVKAKKTAAQPE